MRGPPSRGTRRYVAKLDAIAERDGPNCWLCGEVLPQCDRTIDHAIPKARGGANHLHNLRLAHSFCNSRRGAIESARCVPIKVAANHARRAAVALAAWAASLIKTAQPQGE